MMRIFTTGEYYTEYKGLCDVYRKGYYYIENIDICIDEKVNCTVGYIRDDIGKPHEAFIFVKDQVTEYGTHINAYTQEVKSYDFDFENEFDYIYLCLHCIEYMKSRGEYVYVGEEINVYNWETREYEMIPCEWCEENDDTLYECHF